MSDKKDGADGELHIDDIKASAGGIGEQLACKHVSLCADLAAGVMLHIRPHTLTKTVAHTGTSQLLKPAAHVLCSLANSNYRTFALCRWIAVV